MANRTADVVVIGGGVNGTSIAMHLTKLGAGKVILVEKKHLASGASGRSGAMVREHYLHPTLVKMAMEASRIFHNFSDVIGGDARFRQTGRVLLFGEHERPAVEANVAMNLELGVNITTLSNSEIQKLIPKASIDDIAIGVYEPDSGYADPVATTYAYADNAVRNGAEIMVNTPVVGLQANGGKITGIVTNDGVIETNTVVNAAGPWGNLIGGQVNDVMPIRPIRVQMVHLRRPPSLDDLEVNVIDYNTGAYFRVDAGFNTLVGGENLDDLQETVDPNNFGLNADHSVITKFWDRARKRFPDFDAAICRGGYGSLYDMTPDGNPILDKSPRIEGLFWAVGFSGHGFKLSPVVGRMMAEFVMEGKSREHDISKFRTSRFAENDFLLPKHPYAGRAHQ